MNKQDYQNSIKEQKVIIKSANERINELRGQYIQQNKPCEKGDLVEIVLKSGRKVKGEAFSFGILQDKNVHVTAYKQGTQLKYISTPNISVTVLAN